MAQSCWGGQEFSWGRPIGAGMVSRGPTVGGVLGSAAVAVAMGIGAGAAAADTGAVPLPGCRPLVVIGIPGTGQSPPSADPQADTGVIGSIIGPAQNSDLEQVVIPYSASFGGVVGTAPGPPMAVSALQALSLTDNTVAEGAKQCPAAKFAVLGYSQGGGVASDFARQEGDGAGPVPVDRIAGVAALSDWTRPPGSQAVPGRTGQQSTDRVPGTSGAATSSVRFAPVPDSGGIASDPSDFGKMDGRVVEICRPGDLACDAPAGADGLTVAAGIAAHTSFNDPIAAVTSAGAALSGTVSTAVNETLLDDVQIQGGQIDYTPRRTLSNRLAQAAVQPNPGPPPEQSQAANAKARAVAAAVVADPIGQLPHLAAEITAAIGPNLAANANDPAALLHLVDTVGPHESYSADPQVTQWLSAMARDSAGGRR